MGYITDPTGERCKAILDSSCFCLIRIECGGIILLECKHPSCCDKTEMSFLCLIYNRSDISLTGSKSTQLPLYFSMAALRERMWPMSTFQH